MRTMNALSRWSSLLLVMLACPTMSAQVLTHVHPSELERADAGIEDVDPLLMGRVNLQVDLHTPYDFDGVYKLPGVNGGPERYVRFSGGLAAVFERSDYIGSNENLSALAPPGTVFYLGGVPMDAPEASVDGPLPGAAVRLNADTRVDHQVDSERVTSRSGRVDLRVPNDRQAVAPTLGRITQDPTYRSARIRELLRAAAQRK